MTQNDQCFDNRLKDEPRVGTPIRPNLRLFNDSVNTKPGPELKLLYEGSGVEVFITACHSKSP